MIIYDEKNNALRGVRAAVFDLDGTLFDSLDVWEKIDVDYLKKRNLEPDDEYRRAIAALGNLETAKFSVEYFKLNEQPERLAAEWTEMAIRAYSETVPLLEGAAEYLRECAARGIRILAVTSLDKALALPCLENNGIIGLFDRIITADEAGLSKSTPMMYAHAAQCAGEAACDCVVFDDVAAALRAAKAAGMITVAITGAGGYYAFDECDADCFAVNLARAPRLEKDA